MEFCCWLRKAAKEKREDGGFDVADRTPHTLGIFPGRPRK
jgi:hypothetical protein